MAMDGIEGVVDVEHDLSGRARKRSAIKPHHFTRHPDERPGVGQVFHTRDRGLRAQRRPGLGITLESELERRIISQISRVVAILKSAEIIMIRNRMISAKLCRTLPGSRRSVRQDATRPAKSCRRSTSRKSVRPASELIAAPSKLRRMGLPFKGDKAGAAEVDCITVRGPALETGLSGFNNRKIPEFKSLRHPHHTLMNNSG